MKPLRGSNRATSKAPNLKNKKEADGFRETRGTENPVGDKITCTKHYINNINSSSQSNTSQCFTCLGFLQPSDGTRVKENPSKAAQRRKGEGISFITVFLLVKTYINSWLYNDVKCCEIFTTRLQQYSWRMIVSAAASVFQLK